MTPFATGFGATAAGFGVPHILVGHWNTTGSLISETQVLTGVDIEISTDQMHLTHACLCCLGHIHKAQDLRRGVFYSGSLFAQNWGELEDKGFYIHEIGDEVVSRFVKTPSRKMIRMKDDFTSSDNDHRGGLSITECLIGGEAVSMPDISGAVVRFDLDVWQDEAGQVDKEALRKFYMEAGAIDVDIRVNRIPRENIRADAVLKAETLRDKLIAAAALRDEKVSESILQKADALENMDQEELVKMIGKGALHG
jgi:DNA repair exonuclease SbcCD nuclease subunit